MSCTAFCKWMILEWKFDGWKDRKRCVCQLHNGGDLTRDTYIDCQDYDKKLEQTQSGCRCSRRHGRHQRCLWFARRFNVDNRNNALSCTSARFVPVLIQSPYQLHNVTLSVTQTSQQFWRPTSLHHQTHSTSARQQTSPRGHVLPAGNRTDMELSPVYC